MQIIVETVMYLETVEAQSVQSDSESHERRDTLQEFTFQLVPATLTVRILVTFSLGYI